MPSIQCANYNNPSCPRIADATQIILIHKNITSNFPSNLTYNTPKNFYIYRAEFDNNNYQSLDLCEKCFDIIKTLALSKNYNISRVNLLEKQSINSPLINLYHSICIQ